MIKLGFFSVLVLSFFAHAQLPNGKSLTQKEAEIRAELIKNVDYDLNVNLTNDKFFEGVQSVNFALSKVDDDLRLDFRTGTVEGLTVNGTEVKKINQDDRVLWIPEDLLKVGTNKVEVRFRQNYNHNGIGLHRYKDPEDGEDYLFTQFEPNDASLFMPCFDQPDIKATLTMQVTAPPNWTVISTKKETSVTPSGKGSKKWSFPKTWPMSTYLFSLHAGPYHQWTGKAGKIPLRLFARKSMAPYVSHEEWLNITKQGLAYYGKYFSYPYPFEKYDQVIVPEFNAGAMENIAAVTFSERYTKRGKSTLEEREHAANVILHEMAHMWFGDLVTMRWWNDLWLNESFATYMATKALAEATIFKNSWKTFFWDDKSWAYASDQYPTTHPISTKIQNADEAFNNFDGITYGKGASVMKQLAYLIGEQDFQKGLQNYFAKYAFKNATLRDFISALAEKSPQDLTKWSSTWLETMGVDTLVVEPVCKDSKFEKLLVHVDSASADRPKTHAFEVIFMNFKGEKLAITHKATLKVKEDIEYKKEGVKCPDVVFPNYGDYGYFKVKLDGGTVVNLKKDLMKTDDPFLRLMFWDVLWQMTRDQQFPLLDYISLYKKNIADEDSFGNAFVTARTISGGKHFRTNSVYFFYPASRRQDLMKRQEMVHNMEDLHLNLAKKAVPGSDLQQLWVDKFIQSAETSKGQDGLIKWLKGDLKFKGLNSDPDRRWKAIVKLCTLGNPKGLSFMEAEKQKDKSQRAKTSALECQASVPDLEAKKQWWNKITDPKSDLSLNDKRQMMRAFFYGDQKSVFAPQFQDDYFNILVNSAPYTEEFMEVFTETMGPDNCTRETTVKMKEFVLDHKKISPVVLKIMAELIDDNERCEKVRAKASGKAL